MTLQRLDRLPHHDESSAWVSASPERVFALLNDHSDFKWLLFVRALGWHGASPSTSRGIRLR